MDEETILTDKTDPHTCKMSLGDIEAMLSEDESSEKLGGNNKSPAKEKSLMSSDSIGEEPQLTKDKTSTDETCNNRSNGANNNLTPTSEVRPAWIRCASWDPCSIGTLPGYPV